MMIRVTGHIFIDDKQIEKRFIRASGPGGQNVNKTSTAVQLRYNVKHAVDLPEEVRRRAVKLAGRQATRDGDIIIEARRFRSQEQNLKDAMNRLVRIIRAAAERPKSRRKTRPTRASVKRRLDAKRRQARLKKMRGRVGFDD